MALNIDEGEPGTFKDRWYLERDPHRFLEGMLVAAWCAGVGEIYIYLRDEYAGCRAVLEKELLKLKKDPPCALPPIHVRRGAGAYICGEESAMIESIEGKRGMPRLRPPYVAQVGLFNRPTLEHNLETVYWVRQIVERGAAWFAGHGRNGREGLRSFSVSGRVKQPGVPGRALTDHDGGLDLRPGPGGAQSRADRHEILPARGAVMDRVTQQQVAMMPIEFKLNGQTVVGRPDELIIETARRHGISIPHLCYTRTLRPDGNCRACVVEVKGERALAPSCCRFPTQGMEVTTDSARALTSQKMVLELLLADMPEHEYTLSNKVDVWARKLKVGKPRFRSRPQPRADLSHPAIAVNLDACIQCTRCVRACREEQVNDVIGYAGRGDHSKIVFDFDDPMGEPTYVACGA